MGNHHSASGSGYRTRKNVHWKSAEPPLPPGKPTAVLGEGPDGREGRLRWAPPRHDGGAPLQGYMVECNRMGSPLWVRTNPPLVLGPELILAGLESGFQYRFRVCAQNGVGVSNYSEMSDVLIVASERSGLAVPIFQQGLEDTESMENEKTEFKVYFDGYPTPTVSWFKDGFEIFSSRRTAILTDYNCSTLIFHQTSLNDEGEIKCTITNRAGHAVSRAKLRLQAAPRVRLPRRYEEGLLFDAGETLQLKIAVAGKPNPEIQWRHDGQLITESDRIQISNADKFSALRIVNASRNDRGEYQVNASNVIGEDTASFLVTITAKPDPPINVKASFEGNRTAVLTWEAPDDDGGCQIGNYIVEYYRTGWNVWLKAITERKLTATLSDLIEGSEYRFRVKAENPYGMSDPSSETQSIFVPGKSSNSNILSMIDDQTEKTDNLEIPPVMPRRKRQSSPRYDEEENDSPDIPENVILRKHRNIETITNNEDIYKNTERDTYKDNERNIYKYKEINTYKDTEIDSHTYPKRDIYKNTEMDMHKNGERDLFRNTERKTDRDTENKENIKEAKSATGSSEFMLILYPEGDKSAEDKRKSFQLDLEDAMSPPVLSLSAPQLGANMCLLPPIRYSVSSTELLHEQAMNRVFKVMAMKEAENAKAKNSSLEKNINKLSELKMIPSQKETNIFKASKEEKEPIDVIEEDKLEIDSKENLYEINEMKSEESLNKSEDNNSLFEDDYTTSTVSTGDSEYSDSDSLEEGRRKHDFSEDNTYHPRNMTPKAIPINKKEKVTPKPIPLPDPNFIPKPILKKRGPDITPPATVASKVEKTKSKPLLSKVPLLNRITKSSDKKDKKLSKNVSEPIKSESEKSPTELKKPLPQALQKYESDFDGGHLIAERYGNIVKEFSNSKKQQSVLYTNTDDLKKAAGEQQSDDENPPPKPTPVKKTILKKAAKPVAKPAGQKPAELPKRNAEPKAIAEPKTPAESKIVKPAEPKKSKKSSSANHSPVVMTVSLPKNFSELNAEAENNVKNAFNYVFNIFMVVVAAWLYFFKSELLAIPFLALAIYRELHRALKDRMPTWLTNRLSSTK